MLARASFRAASAPTLIARRGFQSTRAQMSSPYHYPEGPRSNLPFDPLKKGFAFKFWGFMGKLSAPMATTNGGRTELTTTGTGFALPFLLAGELFNFATSSGWPKLINVISQSGKPRRTSPERAEMQYGYRHLGGNGPCRISGGPAYGYTRHYSINFILCPHGCIACTPSCSMCCLHYVHGTWLSIWYQTLLQSIEQLLGPPPWQ
jgi:cytochrome c oxidase subunit 7c